jgi:hypothetical protein
MSPASAFALWLIGTVLYLNGAARSQEPASSQPIPAQNILPAINTQVRNGEVLYVAKPDLVLRLENERIAHFVVPETAKFNVDGRSMSLDELRPGMRLTETLTTPYAPELSPAGASQAAQSAQNGSLATPGVPPPNKQAAQPSQRLPATATPLPCLGLVGLASLLVGWSFGKRCGT